MNKTTYSCDCSGFSFTAIVVEGCKLPQIMVEIPRRLDEVQDNNLSFSQIRNLHFETDCSKNRASIERTNKGLHL